MHIDEGTIKLLKTKTLLNCNNLTNPNKNVGDVSIKYLIVRTYINVLLSQIKCFGLRTNSSLSASSLFRASLVERANGLSVGIEVQVKEDLEVGVQHEVSLVVVANSLPLPAWNTVLVTGILLFK
jgi:hypothetical protein